MGGLRLSCGKEGGVWVETFQPSPRFSLESMAGGGGVEWGRAVGSCDCLAFDQL